MSGDRGLFLSMRGPLTCNSCRKGEDCFHGASHHFSILVPFLKRGVSHRLCSSHRNVPSCSKLYSQSWRWFFICICGGSWNWTCVSRALDIPCFILCLWCRDSCDTGTMKFMWRNHVHVHMSLALASDLSSVKILFMIWSFIFRCFSNGKRN